MHDAQMTSRLVTPWWRSREFTERPSASGGVAATRTLDWESSAVQSLLAETRAGSPAATERELLMGAHALIAARVRPVYSLDDSQPASRTLAVGRGSCSQRLAALEAVARAGGVPTRVRGFLIDGRFWYPRFPRLRFAVPASVVLAWPEFLVAGVWVDASELFGPVGSLSGSRGFSNADGETLFDALTRTAVDWDGVTSTPSTCSACDLSGNVLRDLGRFDSRDDLFDRHGQTLCLPARVLGGPVMGRWSAGAPVPSA